VEIENINRNLAMGKKPSSAILDGAQQIAVPALFPRSAFVSSSFPCFFCRLAKFLFVPLPKP